jgi:hypothetical protein
VTEGSHVASRRDRRIRYDDIQDVQREICQELVVGVLVADDSHWFGQRQRRLKEPTDDELGYDVDDANR